jgi:DNA-binding transcriptional LysR family regulator
MREVDLRGIDLNLLVLLDALIEQRNVTRAAEKMLMSQPAMSRVLGRLRKLLNDPILVRGGDGLLATPRAIALQPELKRLLKEISDLVSDLPFDPERLTGCVTLAATDHISVVLLPQIVTRLNRAAPKLDLKVIPVFDLAEDRLHDGRVDLAFGVDRTPLPATLCQESLYEDTYITLIRSGHPIVGGGSLGEPLRMEMEQFVALNHVLVTAVGDGRGFLDTALAELGLQRRVVLQLPNFITALAVVAESDFVVTLPASIARRYAVQNGLVAIAPPIAYPVVIHTSIWSGVRNADPSHQWLRQLVREAAGEIESSPVL